MRTFPLDRFALMSVAALLAGCGGSQPPIGAQGAMPQSRAIATYAGHGGRGGSQILPDSNHDLLYVNDSPNILVFSFPQGNEVGKITNVGSLQGACADKNGNVFVVVLGNGSSSVLEYAHGGTSPIGSFGVPSRGAGCAADPTTNDLAVTTNGNSGASVAVFQNESGSPQIYTDPNFGSFVYCGYDDKGNLFIDGQNGGSGSGLPPLDELKSGSGAFTQIAVNQKLQFYGIVQWQGSYLAAGETDSLGHTVYHVRISGRQGHIVGATTLRGRPWGEGWIENGIVAQALRSGHGGDVSLYHYPRGGKPIKTLPRGAFRPSSRVWGVTVSAAPSR